jgi:electron transfer flavoprotein beta subunit
VSPHEECAVEEALRIGGSTTVLTLGPAAAVEQLQNALAMGIEQAVLLETDGDDWGPQATAAAIVDAVRDRGFDLLLFGNESADNGNYQVAVRVAAALGLPCVTGIKGIEIADGVVTARREAGGGWEIFELPLPAVVSVREGINLPRYPSLPGRLKAKKAKIERITPERGAEGLEKVRLVVPQEEAKTVQILPGAREVADLLRNLGLAS